MSSFGFRAARLFVRRQQGAVILETALMLMVLLIFAFGIIDFGRVMYVANAVTNATRDGARWAAVQSAIPSTPTIQNAVCRPFNDSTCGNAGPNGFRFGGPVIQAANVQVFPPNCTPTPPTLPTLTITIVTTYPFNWLTPLPRLMRWTQNATPFTSNISAKAVFKYEWCN
jgi:Flp pilus assembly protein TadG